MQDHAQYGVGDAGLLKLRAEGHPVVVLAQFFQHSPNILITKRTSNIFSPYELVGKNVMLPENPAGSAAVRAMLLNTLGSMERVSILPRRNDETSLISGQADAVAGYLSNEPFLLKQRGLAINIVDPRSYGIDFYGDNLYTTEKEILTHPERVEKILRATVKGWAHALKNKEAVIDLILAKYNPSISREQLRFEARVIDQMVLADLIPIGDINPRRYARIAEIFHQTGMSPSPAIPEGFFITKSPIIMSG